MRLSAPLAIPSPSISQQVAEAGPITPMQVEASPSTSTGDGRQGICRQTLRLISTELCTVGVVHIC